ncbi:AsmA family protein [Shewanella sp. WXL01]|uniref:AsmA family protein n=1 Tax=Shewanella sp. WXL01 TaxID=2709721 RepID=UPI00143835B4|nr:AsmA family protein [Shewanella sp. WXL01]NKF51457.1 AsmA family protein [Shewanella sp. WXL01]
MKIIKWVVIALALLVTGFVVYITQIFNLNDFKPQIIEAVETETGRKLQINQDLSWSFFPSIGINLGGIALSNPQGFSDAQMVQVNQVVANVSLMPLLSKQIEVEELVLDGLVVNLVTTKDGRTSFDGLTKEEQAKSEASAPKADGKSSFDPSSVYVGGISVTNTQINLIDEQSATKQAFTLTSFKLGEFELGKTADFSYVFEAVLPDMNAKSQGKGQLTVGKDIQSVSVSGFSIENTLTGANLPNNKVVGNVSAELNVNLASKALELVLSQIQVDAINGNGDIKVNYGTKVPQIDVNLAFNEIDLNPYMPAQQDGESQQAPDDSNQASTPASEPDLSALKTLDVDFTFKAKAIKAQKLVTENWDMTTSIKNGVINLSNLSADMYEGSLLTKAKLDGRAKVPSYSFDMSVNGVQFRPLLTDAAEVDMLSGNANIKVTGSGKSLIPDNLKRNLNAKGNFEIADGSLYGVNIPQMIRSAKQKLSGDLSSAKPEEQKTDFTSLTGSFTLAKSVLNNPDLAMASPLLRLAGKGNANIDTQTIDYGLTASVVGSLAGQGGDDSLSGVDIPLSISGSFAEPKFALDTEALLNQKLKQETEKAKDKLKDKLFEKLGGF